MGQRFVFQGTISMIRELGAAKSSHEFLNAPCPVATPLEKVIIRKIMPKQPGSEAKLRSFNRRRFLKTAGTAAILPAVLPAYALQSSGTSPNNRINLGV